MAFVDDGDYELLSQFKWHAMFDGYNWYAKKRDGTHKHVSMHTFLMKPPVGVFIDHWDRNGLNNQRANLRICTHAQNCQNRFRCNSNRSGFKGVSWKTKNKKWCAQIKLGKIVKHIGLFSDPKEAAVAYDAELVKHCGDWGLTNKRLGRL